MTPYIKAKSDKKDLNGKIIEYGQDLFLHTEGVLDSAFIVNNVGNYGLSYEILKWFSIVHDLGKANPIFQSNMEGITSAKEKCCRHEISSVLFIDIVPKEIQDIVALLVLSHHKSLCFGDDRSLKSICDIYGYGDEWFSKHNDRLWNHVNGIDEWGKSIADFLKVHYAIHAKIPTLDRCKEILYKYSTIELENGYSEYRGLCMMADHIASAFENGTERIINLGKLFKVPDISFYFGENERYPLSLIRKDENKRHTFCVAPCGCGKTNFMMKVCTKRIFYILPYQASINAMQKRLQNDLGCDFTVGIKHASYKSLNFIDDYTKTLSSLFGLPVKVMTPFQLIGVLFRTKGYESLIMDLKGQDVILDEIHTYSGKNQTCVIELIKMLKEFGCNIHICTATMPTALKDVIVDILGEDDTQVVRLPSDILTTFNRRIIHTVESFDFDDIIRRYNEGEKILIVKNQKKAARAVFSYIVDNYPTVKVLLLHSEFERGRRAELEEILMRDFNGLDEPCIVVSTQVVEVSLDIDFDVMYTDCSDIMSLTQRFGRVGRKRVCDGTYKDVYVVNSTNDMSYKPYDIDVCNRTFEELSKIDGKVLDENYIQTIIDNVFDTIDLTKFNMANPYENGVWKSEMYTHNVNDSIPKLLEYDGCICIKESNVEEYKRTLNVALEIPVSSYKAAASRLPLIDSDRLGGKQVYVVKDLFYSDKLGLLL